MFVPMIILRMNVFKQYPEVPDKIHLLIFSTDDY